MRRPPVDLVLLAAAVAVVGAFAVVPAAELIARGIAAGGGTRAVSAVLADPANRRAFSNSFLQGGLSAALAMAIGYPAGVFLGRYRWPGRAVVRSALLLAFLLPTLVMVLGVLDLLGPTGLLGGPVPGLRWLASGVPGIVAVNLFYNVPIVVVLTATGCEASSSSLEETVASLGGSPVRAYRESWAAPSWAGAACGGLLTFVLSALSFAPPVLLCAGSRCDTVEVRVYALAETFGEPLTAGVLALVLLGAFLAPALGYVLLTRRLRPAAGATSRPRPPDPSSPATWALAATFALVVASELALVAGVLVRSVVPTGGASVGSGWRELFSAATAARLGVSTVGAVGNTLYFATLAAAVGIVLSVASAFVGSRRPRLATPLAALLFVPVLLSPVVLAVALTVFWLPTLGGAANVWLLIVLSQALLAVPFALQSLEIPLAGLPRSGVEAAATLGATPWGAFVDVDLPRLRRGVETALLFAFALGLGEFTATYFLVSSASGFRTVPVAVFALTSTRQTAAADAAAGLLLVLSLAVFAVIVLVGRDDRD
jgi:thiamine transport system permease protein